ncbi:TonB-dependent receptor family protein [Flavobacterium sp. GSA192]|uniref:TonB-dependent receptor family protein n=1 Tax=Flavobacterium sp. GSA192 TaxID=2576304 RepID=UPI001126E58D|nr:TonB-dependent receptor [Flavobacterium sp. GSA192]
MTIEIRLNNQKKVFTCLICLLVLLSGISVFGQAKKDTLSLSELVLSAAPIRKNIQNTAAAVSIITEKEINQTDGVILTPVLNKIPGVYMQQGALNTNRITIRGIGARTQYGTSRIKAYFEGIPLSDAEGETVLEDIDLEALGGIEIIKGPNSSSFGAGLGGVISLKAKQIDEEVTFGKSGTTFGSFGLMKQILSVGSADSNSSVFVNYSNLQQDGYRVNSDYNRKSLNLFGKQRLSGKSTLSFFGIATRLKAFIPSSISETAFNNNPKSAAATWLAAKGFESYDKLLAGLGLEYQFSENWSMDNSFFTTLKNAYEARPFDILEDKTKSVGFRSKVNYSSSLFTLPNVISLGTEFITENYNFSLFRNLYQSNSGKGSLQGERFAKMEQNRRCWNAFLQMETKLSTKLNLESGIAFNTTHYNQVAIFSEAGIKQNYSFESIWSPRIGLSYKIDNGKNIYTSLSKGFSIPVVAETLTTEGQINTDLKPEVGVNYEVGFKGNFLGRKLYAELVFYSAQIKNLLVARRIADDQYVGINAGESSHQGMEFVVNYKFDANANIQLNPYLSGTITRFKFKDFVDRDSDFSGKLLPAVPNVQLNAGLDLVTAMGLSFNASYRYTGKRYLDDANSKETKGHQLLDAKASYVFYVLKKIKMEMNVGIQNVLNENYAASVLPNAVGFGTAPARYYYPGNPVNYYGGFNVVYVFN